MKYDLHVHSYFSDGDYSPKGLVNLYRGKLDGLALTDHDTIDGVAETIDEARKTGLDIIPGIEFSCSYRGSDVHILGLGIDIYNKELIETTKILKKARNLRAEKMLDLLYEDGIILNRDKLLKNNRVGRPHIALELIDKGFVRSVEEAFSIYLSRGSRYYIDKENLSIEEATKLINLSGGKSILAHPGSLVHLDEVIELCLGLDIDGIEVYHPSNKKGLSEDMANLCRERELIMTGGSDFHRNIGDIGRYFIDTSESFIEEVIYNGRKTRKK